MKKLIPLFLIFLLTGVAFGSKPASDNNKKTFEPRLAIGGIASTNGLGANIIYSFSDKIDIRGGFEQLSFNRNFDFHEDNIKYNADVDYRAGSFSVLADYHIFNHFYLALGAGVNRFKPVVEGHAVSDMVYGDISIPAEDIGTFDLTFEPGLKVSPYGGFGFGRNIGLQKNVAFNFEIGTYYLGPPEVTIHAEGLLAPTADPAHGQKELYERQLESYRFYPVIKLGLSVRIF
jgi:hypothetical protein